MHTLIRMAKKRPQPAKPVASSENSQTLATAPPPEARPSLSSRIPVFLSYPTPAFKAQAAFIERIRKFLEDRGFGPRTLGVTDYDMDAPLTAIRRLLHESNGLITIAFHRITQYLASSADFNSANLTGSFAARSVVSAMSVRRL